MNEPTFHHVFRWDLDKTYLRTDFETIRDLVRTALQTPEDKVNVPGAVELLRELQEPVDGRETLVTFISGSPSQMRDTLEQKFELDGIVPDELLLKPTLDYILKGRFGAVRGQVGYKLGALLQLREEGPSAPETLFGDDAEQDAFIYSLYADLGAGRIDLETLDAILDEADVHEEARASIRERASGLEVRDTVRRIFIHLEERTPPGRFWVFGPRVVPIVNYFQAAVLLFDDETIGAPAVARVAAGMMERYDYGLLDLTNSFEDLMRRRHLELETVEHLGSELKSRGGHDGLPADFVDRLVARTRGLAPRAGRGGARDWNGPPDYLDVLRSDRRLRESVRESDDLFS